MLRCRILRQYIPFLDKTFVLSRLPEFCELLDEHSSWFKPAEPLIKLHHILRFLEPGFYWNLDRNISIYYYVSIDAEKISFLLCNIHTDTLFDTIFAWDRELCLNEKICVSLQTMHNFFTLFLKKYSITNSIRIYKLNSDQYFSINFSTKKVHWGKEVYVIENKICIIRHNETETYIIKMKQNDIIKLIHYKKKPFQRTEEEIEPLNKYLEADIFNVQEKVYDDRKILQIDFRIREDHVCLHRHVFVSDYIRFVSRGEPEMVFNLDGVVQLRHILENELKNLFVPLPCKCTKNRECIIM